MNIIGTWPIIENIGQNRLKFCQTWKLRITRFGPENNCSLKQRVSFVFDLHNISHNITHIVACWFTTNIHISTEIVLYLSNFFSRCGWMHSVFISSFCLYFTSILFPSFQNKIFFVKSRNNPLIIEHFNYSIF